MQNISMSDLVMQDGDKYFLLGNRVLIELDKSNEYFEINGKKSSIIIPDRFQRFVYCGIIRAIGTDVRNDQYNLAINSKVLYCSTLKGLNLKIDENEYKIIAPYDLEAIVEANDVIKPIMDRVLILPTEQAVKGRIIVPDTVKQDQTCSGIVKAVGPGILDESGEQVSLSVKVGDSVYYSRFTGMNVPINGQNHVIISESNIFFIFEQNKLGE